MKTLDMKTHFPFCVPEPRFMKPVEQVFCVVWLAQRYSLRELRKRQELIDLQIKEAQQKKLNQALEDLSMMRDNHTAAVAYQSFKDDSWMAFIKC